MLKMIIVVGLVLLMVGVVGATEFGFKFRRDCVGDGCVLLLHGFTRYVKVGKLWVGVEDAGSLKGSPVECVSLEDAHYLVECLDYNLTSLTVRVGLKDVRDVGRQFPVRYYGVDGLELVGKEQAWVLSSLSERPVVKLDYSFGERVHFGADSTVVFLNDSYDLDDTYVDEQNPTLALGGSTILQLKNLSGFNNYVLFRWNTSLIPAGMVVDGANLSLSVQSNALDVDTEGFNMTPYRIVESYDCSGIGFGEWDELCVNWNIRPWGANLTFEGDPSFRWFGGVSEPLGRLNFSVSGVVSSSYVDGLNHSEFMLVTSDVFGSPSSTDYVRFWSKEYSSDVALRPALYVSYSVAPAGLNCSRPGSGVWVVPGGCTVSGQVVSDHLLNVGGVHFLVSDGDVGVV